MGVRRDRHGRIVGRREVIYVTKKGAWKSHGLDKDVNKLGSGFANLTFLLYNSPSLRKRRRMM